MRRSNCNVLIACQRGATLVVALLIVVLIMMIGITAVISSKTQYILSGNLQFEDSAMNNAEIAVVTAEAWLRTNYNDAGFTTYSAITTPHLYPSTSVLNPLTMIWSDANSLSLSANQRYYIQQRSTNNILFGSSQAVGGRASAACNSVNTYDVIVRATSARGATKMVWAFDGILNC